MDLTQFKALPIMGIIRGVNSEGLEPLTRAITDSGLETVEITMNTAGASELLKRMNRLAGNKLFIGAGTVLSMDSLHAALDAGAKYIVMPTLVQEVAAYCVKHKVPVFPGGFSPQEVYNAWQSGASMVKVFPAKFFGPEYIKELKGPFQDIELLACGGVDAGNISAFFEAGASAVAFGGSIFKPEWMNDKSASRITEAVEELIESYKKIDRCPSLPRAC